MNCPKCGHAIHGFCCETCGFDLKQDKLTYIGTAASQEISALAAYMDEEEKEPEGKITKEPVPDNVRKKNEEMDRLDQAASRSLKETFLLALCSCLLLGLTYILRKLEWEEFRIHLTIASLVVGIAAVSTVISIPLHIFVKYLDLRDELDEGSTDKYENILLIFKLLAKTGDIPILSFILQIICKIFSWAPGRVFFNRILIYLYPALALEYFAEPIANYLTRLRARGKYSRLQCTLWAALAAVLCISLAVLLYLGHADIFLRITEE